MMKISSEEITLSKEDLKEIYSLFTSVTKYEKGQIYQKGNDHYYKDVDLLEEYELTQEKESYSLDSWRAVLSFLHSKGYSLLKDNVAYDLSWVDNEFGD